MKKSLHDRLLKKYGVESWYHHNLARWGVKWNIDGDDAYIDTSLNGDGTATLTLSFLSAWSGPDRWFLSVTEAYDLDGVYRDIEPGCDFFHQIVVENGELVETVETAYLSPQSLLVYGTDRFEHDMDYFASEECDNKDWEETKNQLLGEADDDSSLKMVEHFIEEVEKLRAGCAA